MEPREVLQAFDHYLAGRNLRLEGVVIGGTALNLLGVVARPTKDCDILYPPLPDAVVNAARAFIDLGDCIALAPTEGELEAIMPWLGYQDLNPDWPAHVRATMADLGRRLGHAV